MSIKQAIEALEEADALLALGFNVENQIAEALTALRSMPAEPEPFAWATFDGEGSYDLRLYQDNENYRDEYLKRNGPQFRSWVTPLYATPHTAPVPPDWSEVGRLLDAVSAAYAGRYMVGTTNWAAFICRQMKQATPHPAPVPAEPVAWYDVENGQIISAPRWYSDGGRTEAPLYAAPPAAPVLTESWQPIETAPRDGSVFVAARFVEGETPDPDFDCELGRYKPLVFDRYEEAGDNLFRKVPEQVYDWHGFNNFGRMTHWMPLPPAAVIGRAGGGA